MHIELHGIDSVPQSERKTTWTDLFMIWAGVSLCLPSFITGALLIPAFSWGKALEINFLGNLVVGILIVLGGYFGTKTGCPAVVYGRHVFGYPLGHWLPTAFLLFSTLGWYAVMTAMTGAALNEIINMATGFSSPVLMTIFAGFLNLSTAVLGYQRIRWLNRISVPLLSILCIWMTYKILSLTVIPDAFQYQPNGSLSYGEGMDIIIGGFLSGAFVASDFSRYARNNRHNWFGTLPGTFLVSFLLGLIGMLAVTVTGAWNPVLVVQNIGLGIPALIFILLANWTTNHSIIYSSGLALTNVLPQLGRWKNTILCGIAGIVLAVAGLTDFLQAWLILLSVILSPLLGVVLTDFLIIKRENRTTANMQAIFSVGAGILLAKITPPQYIASAVGLVSSSIIYMMLMMLKKQACSKNTE